MPNTNLFRFLFAILLLQVNYTLCAQNGKSEEYTNEIRLALQAKSVSDSPINEKIEALEILIRESSALIEGEDYILLLDSLSNGFQGLNKKKYELYKEGIHHKYHGDPDTAIAKLIGFIEESDKEQLVMGMGCTLSSIRNVFKQAGKTEEMKAFYLKKLAYYKEHGPQENMGSCYHGLGSYSFYKGDYNNAIENYLKAMEAFPYDAGTYAIEYAVIGTCYKSWGNDEKAIEYLRKAIPLFLEAEETINVNYARIQLSRIFTKNKEYDKALAESYIVEESLKEFYQVPAFTAANLLDIAESCFFLNDIEKGLPYLLRAKVMKDSFNLPMSNTVGNFELEYINYLYAYKIGNKSAAEESLKTALALSESMHPLYKKYLKELALFYTRQGETDKAIEYSAAYFHKGDSLDALSKSTAFISQYELEMSEKEAKEAKYKRKNQFKRLLAVILGVGVLALILFIRMRNVKKVKKIIEKEKKRSDDLLLNILPAAIAEELKKNGEVVSKEHSDVAVIFSDFVSFTKIAKTMTASELIEEINSSFKAFDDIMTKYQIEKIKTIGDAYMAVSGIPTRQPNSLKNAVSAGLEMQAFLINRRAAKPNKTVFEMRLGIHSGDIIAGVVGSKKFQYDVWGDAVNIASRVESKSRTNMVCVSKKVYENLKGDPLFTFESNGYTEIKGNAEKMELFTVHFTKTSSI